MAPRIPATGEEILALLDEFIERRSSIAVPLYDFYRFAQRRLGTTGPRARQWINDAATEQGARVRIMDVTSGSFFRTLVTNTDASKVYRTHWAMWDGFDKITYEAQPRLDIHGRLTEDREQYAPDNTDFILPAKTLDELLLKAAERTAELNIERKAKRTAGIEAAEATHGEGIAFVRGLLAMADIKRAYPWFEVHHNPDLAGPMRDMSTHVEVNLYGQELDALAAVLKELGVKPRRRSTADNARADLKRVPVKVDTAAPESREA